MKERYAEKKFIFVEDKLKTKVNTLKIAKKYKSLLKKTNPSEYSKIMKNEKFNAKMKETEPEVSYQIKESIMKNISQNPINEKIKAFIMDEIDPSVSSQSIITNNLFFQKNQAEKLLNLKITPLKNEANCQSLSVMAQTNKLAPNFSSQLSYSLQSQINALVNHSKSNIVNTNIINSRNLLSNIGISNVQPQKDNHKSSIMTNFLAHSNNISNIKAASNFFNQQNFQKIESQKLSDQQLSSSNIQKKYASNTRTSNLLAHQNQNNIFNSISQQIQLLNLLCPSINSFQNLQNISAQQSMNSLTSQNTSSFDQLVKFNEFIEKATLIDNLNFINAKMTGNLPSFSRYNTKE